MPCVIKLNQRISQFPYLHGGFTTVYDHVYLYVYVYYDPLLLYRFRAWKRRSIFLPNIRHIRKRGKSAKIFRLMLFRKEIFLFFEGCQCFKIFLWLCGLKTDFPNLTPLIRYRRSNRSDTSAHLSNLCKRLAFLASANSPFAFLFLYSIIIYDLVQRWLPRWTSCRAASTSRKALSDDIDSHRTSIGMTNDLRISPDTTEQDRYAEI